MLHLTGLCLLRVFSCLSPAFGGRIQQPLAVVLVATHADLADIPRAFSGEFTYDKEKVLLKEVRNRLGPQQRSDQMNYLHLLCEDSANWLQN